MNAAAGVGLQRHVHRLLEVAVLERHCTARSGFGFAGAAEQLDHVVGAELGQVQVLDLVGPVDAVERERLGRRQVDASCSGSGSCTLAVQRDGQSCQPRRHAELVDRFAVLEQLEVRHLGRGRDAVVVGRRDPQPHVFQQLHRHRLAVELKPGPDQHGGDPLRQQRFAVDVDAGRRRYASAWWSR